MFVKSFFNPQEVFITFVRDDKMVLDIDAKHMSNVDQTFEQNDLRNKTTALQKQNAIANNSQNKMMGFQMKIEN